MRSNITEWRERLRFNSQDVFEELSDSIGDKFVGAELDEIYWQSAMQVCDINQLAKTVQRRLVMDGQDSLVSIDKKTITDLNQRFASFAREKLKEKNLPDSQYKNTQNHPVLLPETALESNGYIDEALILYALNHDDLLPSSRFSNETALIIMVLRFKVAHTYHLLDEKNDAVTRKAVELLENIEPLYKKLRDAGNIPHEQLRTFIHLSQGWLGHRYAALKDFNSATQAFKLAAKNADDVNEIVENICMAADSLVKLNKKQEAYRLLLSVKDLLEVVDAPDIRKAWDLHYLKLHSSLGGHDLRPNEMGTIRSLFTTINLWVSIDKKPSYQKLTRIQQKLKIKLEKGRNKEEESIDNHGMLLIETVPLLAKEGTECINEARKLMKQAEALEKEFTEEKPKVERKLLYARLLMYAGEGNPTDEFNTLWSQAQKLLEPESFLHEHGFYLEALVRHLSDDNIKRITVLVDGIENILGNLIAKQPNSLARRKIREEYQRVIESAMLALLEVAEKIGMNGETGQSFLRRAWHTILRTRNLELTNTHLCLESQEHSVLDEQRRLENEFHKHLNEQVLHKKGDEHWQPSLDALFDYEASYLKTPQYRLNLDTEPPVNGISLVFFEIKDLISNKPMLILGHQNGHFHVHLIKEDFESQILKSLDDWLDNLKNQCKKKEPEDETVRNNAESAAMSLFFPIIQKLFHNSSSQLAPFTLHLFPDSSTSSLNFEILPPFLEGKLKNYFNIQIHLRSSSPEYDKVNLSQGWLALGDIPEFGKKFNHLYHALKEIEQIEHILERNGYLNEKNKKVFLDKDAHAGNLAEALETLKPSVVHITTHGDADICRPEETSYLVLADNQGAVEGRCLPFRTIQRLNFSSVDLVVLSVCSGAVGASSRSEGLRGLTWAFLAAGAKQVIASRYPVDDEDTAKFMPLLYEYLAANYPVSEALRLTRNDCLQIPLKISKYQVGAWGLWI